MHDLNIMFSENFYSIETRGIQRNSLSLLPFSTTHPCAAIILVWRWCLQNQGKHDMMLLLLSPMV